LHYNRFFFAAADAWERRQRNNMLFVCLCSPTLKKGFDDQHSGFLRAMKLQVRFAVLLSAIPSASILRNVAPIHLSKRHETFSVFVPYMLFGMLQVDQALKRKSNHTTALSDI
jgi:hypothetical protein